MDGVFVEAPGLAKMEDVGTAKKSITSMDLDGVARFTHRGLNKTSEKGWQSQPAG